MATFGELADLTLLALNGFSANQEQSTYLTSGITASATTLPVADATALSRGMVEIDEELLWVDSVSGTTATLPPYGRGYRSTTAATHASGARVTSSPLIPRKIVKNAINETIQSVYPDLFGVGTTTFTFNPAVSTYQLPAGAQDVLSVTWQTIGPSKEWKPVHRYRVDGTANTTVFTTGVSLSLFDPIVPGRTVQVVYTKIPTSLSTEADVFSTVTGLPSSCEDVIRSGAAWRLIPYLDAPHYSGQSAEADFSSNMRPVGGAQQMGKFLMQQYQIRLQEEATKLLSLYPTRSHYTI